MRTKTALLWLGFLVLLLAGLSLTVPATRATADADAPDDGGSDEAPIRVRGGSMNIEAAVGQRWEREEDGDRSDSNPSYSHEPDGIDPDPFDKMLYVRLVATTAECGEGNLRKNTDRQVWVKYGTSPDTVTLTARFMRAKSGKFNYRTKVRPANVFQPDVTGTVLHHRGTTDGRIVSVGIGDPDRPTWSCRLPTAGTLVEINICSGENKIHCG